MCMFEGYTQNIKHLFWGGHRPSEWTQLQNWVQVWGEPPLSGSNPLGAGLWEGLGGLRGETKVSRIAERISMCTLN